MEQAAARATNFSHECKPGTVTRAFAHMNNDTDLVWKAAPDRAGMDSMKYCPYCGKSLPQTIGEALSSHQS